MSSSTTSDPPPVIQNARKRPLYLASHSTLDLVKWYEEGQAHKLILNTDNHDEATQASVHVLSRISPNDYWLTADASWRGESSICKHLWDAKVTCTLDKPGMPLLDEDFQTSVQTLQTLQQLVARKPATLQRGLFKGPETSPRICLRHVLFQVCLPHDLNFVH
jgi:hypothetical protein